MPALTLFPSELSYSYFLSTSTPQLITYTAIILFSTVRHHLAQILPGFTFSEYASVHSLLDCFLTSNAHITCSEQFCPSGHVTDKWELYRSSSHFVLGRVGCGLQDYMDDMTDLLSEACLVCDVSLWWRFMLMYHPPLVSIELGRMLL